MKSWAHLSKRRQLVEVMKVYKDPVYFASDYFLPNLSHIIPTEPKASIIREFYSGGYTEMDLIAGMRSGKSTLLTFFMALETFHILTTDYIRKYDLARGTPIMGVFCSAKEEQAAEELFDPYCAWIEESPYFRDQACDIYARSVVFPDRNYKIRPIAANAATEAGKTAKTVCIDEFSKIQSNESFRGAMEIWRTIGKATKTLDADGHIFICGSRKSIDDISTKLYDMGKQTKRVFTPPMMTTWELNSSKTKEDFDEDFLVDPIGAARDFANVPYSSETTYFRDPAIFIFEDRPNYLRMIEDGLAFTAPKRHYIMAGDPAWKHDYFGLAVGHMEQKIFTLDGVVRLSHGKEVDPTKVKDLILNAVEQLGITIFITDIWNYPETIKALEMKRVQVLRHTVKKEDYDIFKTKCWNKEARLLNYRPLELELKGLIIKGRKVDHTRHGDKDVSDAVVNTLWGLTQVQEFTGLELIKVI